MACHGHTADVVLDVFSVEEGVVAAGLAVDLERDVYVGHSLL